MKEIFRQSWARRSPRERVVILVIAGTLLVALYASLLIAANRARPQLHARVLALRSEALRLEQYAAEVERLRAAPARVDSRADLRALVQGQVEAAGLASTLVRLDATDPGHVQVVFGAVPFSDWLNWIVTLNAQNIRLEATRVEALSKPGLVSVTATLVRPVRQ